MSLFFPVNKFSEISFVCITKNPDKSGFQLRLLNSLRTFFAENLQIFTFQYCLKMLAAK